MKVWLLAASLFLSTSSLYAGVTTFAYEGFDSPGNTFGYYFTNSQQNCADTCLAKKLCSLAVYNSADQRCSLKTKTSGFEHSQGDTLLVKLIIPQDNLDYIGGDYRSTQVESWDKCSRICYEESPCVAFTFNKSSHQCWLKTQIVHTESNNNAVSGTRD